MKSLFKWSLLSFSLIVGLQASPLEDYKKAQMIADLDVIKHTFEVGYAPLEWKKEHKNWDLTKEYEHYKQHILDTPSMNTKKFQQIVRDFVHSSSDYHVGIYFCSTEEAALPFSVKAVKGRYFIDWIDVLKLPPSHYALRIGDELISFDGVPVADIVNQFVATVGRSSNELTDEALAAIKLTHRTGRTGDDVPSGTLMIEGISAKTHKNYSYQMIWSYYPEHVIDPFEAIQGLQTLAYLNHHGKKYQGVPKLNIMMASPVQKDLANKQMGHDGGLGARKSFIPPLGNKTWTNDMPSIHLTSDLDELEDSASSSQSDASRSYSFWHAYTYQHPQSSRNIGYIRIPHFMGSRRQVKEFEELIKHMEEHTDALVIDQVNNFGGSVDFLYQLASHLTNRPLTTPLHRIKISQEQVLEAYEILEIIRALEVVFDQADGQINQISERELEEFHAHYNYPYLMFTKKYCEFVLEEWKAGHLLTQPTPISGVDMINPHFKHAYSKPILMLINELDFSGADFLPAILQDNKRVTLFGARTAGAGGYVIGFRFPNNQGIDYFAYTASIAERIDAKKIENLGVTPDIEYVMTADDVQYQYQNYVKAINQAVSQILENSDQ